MADKSLSFLTLFPLLLINNGFDIGHSSEYGLEYVYKAVSMPVLSLFCILR